MNNTESGLFFRNITQQSMECVCSLGVDFDVIFMLSKIDIHEGIRQVTLEGEIISGGIGGMRVWS